MTTKRPTKKELQEAIKEEVMRDLVIQDWEMSEKDQKWWYKSLTNLGKLLQAAWDKRRKTNEEQDHR